MSEYEWIELSKEKTEELERRIMNKMISVYSNVENDMELQDEVKLILNTIEAGYIETKKIKKELDEEYKEDNRPVSFHAHIEQMVLSCVAGKIIYGQDKIDCEIHPYQAGGFHISALIGAVNLMKACDFLTEIKEGDLNFSSWNNIKALKMLDIEKDNEP
jgi:hypothetical protein